MRRQSCRTIRSRNDYGIGVPAEIRKSRDISQMDCRTSDETDNRLEDADEWRSGVQLTTEHQEKTAVELFFILF